MCLCVVPMAIPIRTSAIWDKLPASSKVRYLWRQKDHVPLVGTSVFVLHIVIQESVDKQAQPVLYIFMSTPLCSCQIHPRSIIESVLFMLQPNQFCLLWHPLSLPGKPLPFLQVFIVFILQCFAQCAQLKMVECMTNKVSQNALFDQYFKRGVRSDCGQICVRYFAT